MTWTLIKPIRDNKEDFALLFPGAAYMGDVGDTSHQARVSDHNPDYSTSTGWVRAQDFGDGGEFALASFARWFLDKLRAGWFQEVQYIITRHPANSGTGYFGLFDRRYGWAQQTSSGHDHHLHISYQHGYEYADSHIIETWYSALHPVQQSEDEEDMYSETLPKGFVTTDDSLSRGCALENVNSSAIGRLGGCSLSIATDYSPAKFRVAYHVANESGWRSEIVDITNHGLNPRWQKWLPNGTDAFKVSRIPSSPSDSNDSGFANVMAIYDHK